jgi:flagellar biosynthesis chaperone FliJ
MKFKSFLQVVKSYLLSIAQKMNTPLPLSRGDLVKQNQKYYEKVNQLKLTIAVQNDVIKAQSNSIQSYREDLYTERCRCDALETANEKLIEEKVRDAAAAYNRGWHAGKQNLELSSNYVSAEGLPMHKVIGQ